MSLSHYSFLSVKELSNNGNPFTYFIVKKMSVIDDESHVYRAISLHAVPGVTFPIVWSQAEIENSLTQNIYSSIYFFMFL